MDKVWELHETAVPIQPVGVEAAQVQPGCAAQVVELVREEQV